MNPVVLGALIGEVPVPPIATWSAVRSARIGLVSTELTLKADHNRWLREQRSATYVGMIKFIWDAGGERQTYVTAGPLTPKLISQARKRAGTTSGLATGIWWPRRASTPPNQ